MKITFPTSLQNLCRPWTARPQSRRRYRSHNVIPVQALEDRIVLNSAPSFTPDTYDMNVDENSYGVLGTLSATDPEGDYLTYQITAGDTDLAFEVDSNGDLIVYGYLDFETTASYQLTVEASDGFSSAYATVNITVNDVPEAPVFDPATYSVSVAEDAYGAILQLLATDPQDDLLTYTITGGDTDSVFSIDSDGQLEVFGSLDYETTTSYQLTVEVSDGVETATATVDITVTNGPENEAPVITSLIAIYNGGTSWTFSGTVEDENTAYLYIDFGGILAGHTVSATSDGTFSYTLDLPPGEYGIVSAVTTDVGGLTSNTAQDLVYYI
jgi:hypothetical protein